MMQLLLAALSLPFPLPFVLQLIGVPVYAGMRFLQIGNNLSSKLMSTIELQVKSSDNFFS